MKKLVLFLGLFLACPALARVCPNGGQLSTINPKYCCKGPFVEGYVNGKIRYDFFQPGVCGCPDGGEFKGRSCCKNGYAYGVGSIPLQISDSLGDDVDLSKGKYAFISAESCGCPDGWEAKNGVCCHNGWTRIINSWDGTEDDDYSPWQCGCPDGGILNKEKNVCLKNGYGYNPHIKEYVIVWPYEYGCPDGSTLVKGSSKLMDICCKDNLTYDSNKHSWTKADSRCGCPDGGEASPNAGKGYALVFPCCKDGFMYNPETGKYDKKNDHYCRPEAYRPPKEELNKYKNNPEAFFEYWQQHQDQFKKKEQEKKSKSPYAYERNQK